MGRRRLADSDRRTVQVGVRLSPREAPAVRKAAQARGITPAAFGRLAMLEVAGVPAARRRTPERQRLDAELIVQLRRVGNNLNQLTRLANEQGATGSATAAAVWEVLPVLQEIERR